MLKIFFKDPDFYLENFSVYWFVVRRYNRGTYDLHNEQDQKISIEITRDYLHKRITAYDKECDQAGGDYLVFDVDQEKLKHIMSNYLLGYIVQKMDEYDVKIVKFIVKHWD